MNVMYLGGPFDGEMWPVPSEPKVGHIERIQFLADLQGKATDPGRTDHYVYRFEWRDDADGILRPYYVYVAHGE